MDLEHLRQWVGQTQEASDLLTDRIAQSLRATILPSLPSLPPDQVPLAAHWCLAPPIVPTDELGPDGHLRRGEFLPPVPLPRRMRAGGRLEFRDRLRVGDIVTRRSTIRDVTAKEGRSGPLCFVTVEHAIWTPRGLALLELQHSVYRGADKAKGDGAQAKDDAAPQPTVRPRWMADVRIDPVLLFRYSAICFNSHRIHYDRSYAQDSEGYPGLLVQGPLQATLLVEFAAATQPYRPLAVFEYRNRRPIYENEGMSLNADEDASGLRLWTATADGTVAMEASATW